MRTTIRLPFSTDHQKKKLRLIEIPYSFYLQLVCSSRFEHILAKPLKETYQRLKYDFLERNQFLSDDYLEDYQSEKFIHFINHADIHKFFCRLLSLNYQEKRHLLDLPVGSIAEYFASHDFFGNDKYKNWQNITDDTW